MRLLILASLLFSINASANVCGSDAKKFCGNVDPGKGQLAKCLDDYKDQLSKDCAAELKSFNQKTGKKNPCFQDLAEFCTDIPAEPEKLEYCLLKNESKLSPTCAQDFKGKKPKIIVKNECAQDIVNTCYSELTSPNGSLNFCLVKNRASLSKFCQKNVDNLKEKMRKRNPCFDDTEKFCPTQRRFVDIQDCLSKKVPSLGLECKKLVLNEMEKTKANPCYKDLITHCKTGISPTDQNRCLTLNEKDLSNACRQFRSREEDKVEKMVEMCEADRKKFCANEPQVDGKVVKCLRKNKASLSVNCKNLL